MKKSFLIILSMAVCLMLLTGYAFAESTDRDPGLSRGNLTLGYDTSQHLAERYEQNDTPLTWYPAADGKPLNAYLVTHEDCMVGINKDDMYPVSEKGLVSSITNYLKEWAGEIEDASLGAIRFVDDPDQADILISVRMLYKFYANYRGSGFVAKGYSNQVTFFAYDLSNRNNEASVQKTRSPGKSTSLSGHPSKFWKKPPDFDEGEELKEFVTKIMGWYGYQTALGASDPNLVQKARQTLIARGYLPAGEGVDGMAFDADMESAVRLLQREYGLEETGIIDRVTLVALYYDKASVEDMLAKYPIPAAENTEAPAEGETK